MCISIQIYLYGFIWFLFHFFMSFFFKQTRVRKKKVERKICFVCRSDRLWVSARSVNMPYLSWRLSQQQNRWWDPAGAVGCTQSQDFTSWMNEETDERVIERPLQGKKWNGCWYFDLTRVSYDCVCAFLYACMERVKNTLSKKKVQSFTKLRVVP